MTDVADTDPSRLIDAIDLPVVVLGRDAKVIHCNSAAWAFLGLSPSDPGRTLRHSRVLDGVIGDIEELYEHVTAGGSPAQRELRTRDGSWFVVRTAPLFGAGREVSGAVVTFTNVTGLYAGIEQSIYERDFTKTILNSVVSPLIVLDGTLRVQTANRAFHAMFQLSREETQGTCFFELAKGAWDVPTFRIGLEQLASGPEGHGPAELSTELTSASGRTLSLHARRLSPDRRRSELILLSIDDITARRQAEEADRRKDEFLATLAHELRNPLAPIRTGLEVVRRKLGPSPVDSQLAIMSRQTAHLERIVDDLLEVSRITRGMIELRRTRLDVGDAVSRAVESVRSLVVARKHELSVALPVPAAFIDADPVRVEQVLTNLLANAAKYTEPGGRIWISVERAGGDVEIRVRDTGIGIAKEMIPRVFELFEQGRRDLARSAGGLGIGLSIVKSLTELHGGTVVATSAGVGQGSEFVVRFPRAAEEGATKRKAPQRFEDAGEGSAAMRRLRILVVDDNADARELLAQLLTHFGHEVREAADGPSAILLAGDWRADVIFLDIGMPGMDGYEVAREIRKQNVATQLIALTGYGHEIARSMSRDAGFTQHLVKPPPLEAILGVLRSVASVGGVPPS
ncbi:MAG TPA: ATP-binding protein [Polyangiaceae bacterium]|jgi:two-component system CheB/CheR fusion protein